MTDGKTWLAFLLKDKYATDFEKPRIKSALVHTLDYTPDEIIYTPFVKGNSISYYFFAVDRPDRQDMHSILELRGECFDSYSRPMRITGQELENFLSSIERTENAGEVKFGDIVTIKTGIYCKLNGIVLRKYSDDAIDVGMNFCFGKVIQTYKRGDIKPIDNIFNYIKVLK